MKTAKLVGLLAALAMVATVLVAAVGTASGSSQKKVKLVWWHNATQGEGLKLWTTAIKDFQKTHPNITIKSVPLQNENFKTKIPIALQSSSPPDIFQNWGGGGLVDQVKAHKVANLDKYVKGWIKTVGGSAAGWQVNGHRTRFRTASASWASGTTKTSSRRPASRPAARGRVHRRHRQAEEGRHRPGLGRRRTSGRMRSTGIPRRQVVPEVRDPEGGVDYNFSDPCWLKAGQTQQQLIDAKPFNEGFLATPAQTGRRAPPASSPTARWRWSCRATGSRASPRA